MSAVANVHILKYPIVTTFTSSAGERTETVAEVTLKPLLKAKQLRVLDLHDGEVAKTIALIASLSGLTIAQVDEIHPEDFAVLGEMSQGFTPPGRQTGATS